MGLGALIFLVIIAAWAFWVAWEVNKAGGYPPYQDSCTQDCNQGRNCTCATWPYPKDKP